MAGDLPEIRFVKCPKCCGLLMESADIPVYRCGGCGSVLTTKSRPSNRGGAQLVDPGESPPAASSISDNYSQHGEGPDSECDGKDQSPACADKTAPEAGLTSGYPDPAGPLQAAEMEGTDSVPAIAQPSNREEVSGRNRAGRERRSRGRETSRSSHAHGGVSTDSGGDGTDKNDGYDLPVSRRTFRNGSTSEPRTVGKMQTQMNTTSPNHYCASDNINISGSKQGLDSRHAASSSYSKAFVDPAYPYFLLNEAGNDRLSSPSWSPSESFTSLEDFPCNFSDGVASSRLGGLQSSRPEQSRKVDFLRNQSERSFTGGWQGDPRACGNSSGHGGHRPLFSPKPGTSPAYPRAAMAERHPPARSAFSSRGYGLESYHLPAESFDSPVQHAAGIHGSDRPACFRQSAPRRTSFSEDGSAGRNRHSDANSHELLSLSLKEQKQKRKRRHCRPISGGAPFVLCYICLKLLQLPVDFLVTSGREHKLRCGACSEVIIFFLRGGHVVPGDDAPSESSSGETSDGGYEQPENHHPQRTPRDSMADSAVSDPPPPPNNSFSTDSQPAPCIQESSLEQGGGGAMASDALHRLLGYASARDLIFVASDDDDTTHQGLDIYNLYRAPDSTRAEESHGGTEAAAHPRRPSKIVDGEKEEEEEEKPPARPPIHGAKGEIKKGNRRRSKTTKLKRQEDRERGSWQIMEGEWRFIKDGDRS